MEHEPIVTRIGLLDMQVCVPGEWTDEQIVEFANRENLAGTTNGWQIRRQGDPALGGTNERVPCAAPARDGAGFVHVVLDC